MNFDLLKLYIENKLYKSVEEAHEKIVIYYATGDLTDGEFMTLFDMLYPKQEETHIERSEIEHLNLTDEDFLIEESKEEAHTMPTVALDLIGKMIKAHKLKDMDKKLDMYVTTGQMSEEQYDTITKEEIEEIVGDIPTILPEIDEMDEYEITTLPLI